ncbi:hypothetical protein MIR68_002392 [Amoeboaphelidium protococcarum]|nr:hypothetical protein MIR68_002392 [Amoeboaphelidium protococcarum]
MKMPRMILMLLMTSMVWIAICQAQLTSIYSMASRGDITRRPGRQLSVSTMAQSRRSQEPPRRPKYITSSYPSVFQKKEAVLKFKQEFLTQKQDTGLHRLPQLSMAIQELIRTDSLMTATPEEEMYDIAYFVSDIVSMLKENILNCAKNTKKGKPPTIKAEQLRQLSVLASAALSACTKLIRLHYEDDTYRELMQFKQKQVENAVKAVVAALWQLDDASTFGSYIKYLYPQSARELHIASIVMSIALQASNQLWYQLYKKDKLEYYLELQQFQSAFQSKKSSLSFRVNTKDFSTYWQYQVEGKEVIYPAQVNFYHEDGSIYGRTFLLFDYDSFVSDL